MEKNLYEQLLPPQMFVKALIKGKEESYENYLLEIVNNSLYFCKKTNGNVYVKSKQESHGECDCYAGDYGLDFKLFGSKSMFNVKSNFSSQIIVKDDCIITTSSKIQGKGTYSVLHKLLRQYDFETQKLDIDKKYPYKAFIKDLKSFTKVLLTHKNLIFFYPVKLFFNTQISFNEGLDIIIKFIKKDFLNALKFRENCCKEETYLLFIYNDFFIILKYQNNNLVIVDYINVNNIDAFNRMYWEYVF